MSLISAADQARLTEDFAKMTRPVRLLFFTQTLGCETCLQARQIVGELPPLGERISIEEINLVLEREKASQYGIDRAPAIVLLGQDEQGADRDSGIRFLGSPAGYEFISLVRAVLLVGGGPSSLSDSSLAKIARVDRQVDVHVFTTPTCPHCPRAVILAHEMAWANPRIRSYAVEATEYPDLAQQFRVTGVPKTVVDGQVEILGAIPEDDFVEQALAGFEQDSAVTHQRSAG